MVFASRQLATVSQVAVVYTHDGNWLRDRGRPTCSVGDEYNWDLKEMAVERKDWLLEPVSDRYFFDIWRRYNTLSLGVTIA